MPRFVLVAATPLLAMALFSALTAQEPGAALFVRGLVPRLEFSVPPEGMAALREKPREYVRASLLMDKRTSVDGVGLRLKGAAGSFRNIDDEKPGFTINVAKFGQGDVHGLTKFHLNNCVQDETYLHEWLGNELMRAAKVPAVRCGHARVWLNGKDLGLYVLKEAFDDAFLTRHFGSAEGNFYDGGFCQDIDAELERDSGKGPAAREDLVALLAACREVEPAARYAALEAKLDLDRFFNFMAMELMIGHWDGYCMNANNYRIATDPKNGKFVFLAHGMDQILGDAEAAVLEYPNMKVADAVMRNPTWRAQWRARLTALVPQFDFDRWKPRIQKWADRLEAPLETISKQAASAQRNAVRGLLAQLHARGEFLKEQAKLPEPKSQIFDARGVAKLQGWTAMHEQGAPATRQVDKARKRVLEMTPTNPEAARASWSRKVMLRAGRYELRANALLEGAQPVPEQEWGVRLAVIGLGESPFTNGAAGWTPLALRFEVLEATRLMDLRVGAFLAAGTASFELSSLQLVRVKE